MGVGHVCIIENLWKSDLGVTILYKIVTRWSLYSGVNILYDTGSIGTLKSVIIVLWSDKPSATVGV